MSRGAGSLAAAVVLALVSAGCAPARQDAPPSVAASAPAAPTDGTGSDGTGSDGTGSDGTASSWWRVSGAPVVLASGLAAPWSVAPVPGGGALISERGAGRILELTAAGSLREVGIVPGVVAGGESGLHGLSVWTGDGGRWVYAYHGAADDNRVVRMRLSGTPGALGLGAPEPIVTGIPRNSTHDGGRLAFGPDGFLYISTGDAQQRDAAQDPASLGGKILRVTPDGAPAPGNPFGTAVYSLGHRNVQGLAWTTDGVMWASEFGQNTWDELNRIEPGANYGWPIAEGESDDPRFVSPVATWPTADASPSGLAAVGRTLVLAGLRGERLWFVDTRDGARVGDPVAALMGEQGRLRDAVLAADGTLWVLTNNTDGRGSPRPEDDLLLRLPLVPTGAGE